MTAPPGLGFEHMFAAPTAPDAPTLLRRHGTGGTEHDLLPLAESIAPGGRLSPRGKALERGMPRFFRRRPRRVRPGRSPLRTHELAGFLEAASRHYGFDRARVVAVGFSNGANIAASTLLLEPGVLAAAILFRAMVPLVPDPLPSLQGTPVFMSNGRTDSLDPRGRRRTARRPAPAVGRQRDAAVAARRPPAHAPGCGAGSGVVSGPVLDESGHGMTINAEHAEHAEAFVRVCRALGLPRQAARVERFTERCVQSSLQTRRALCCDVPWL